MCRLDAGPGSQPVLLSFDEKTCTYFFSWHTVLACEEERVVSKLSYFIKLILSKMTWLFKIKIYIYIKSSSLEKKLQHNTFTDLLHSFVLFCRAVVEVK